jgi:ribulose-5-phosphate 4-epimerase/fuculose-1-phosphate aldolase
MSTLHQFHPDEQKYRIQLAACYRIFAMLGWTEMIYNHITLRLPSSVSSDQCHFLINPFGLHYTEVCASNLVKIDLSGKVLDGSTYPINPAGLLLHSAMHENLSGAHCIMHTHTTAGVAVACSQGGLEQSNFYSAQLHDLVAYHDFEGITIRPDEAPRLLKSIGDRPAVILKNHGLLAWGETLPMTFSILWTLQRACEVQIASSQLGPRIRVSEEVAARSTKDSFQFSAHVPGSDLEQSSGPGSDLFDALVRQVDRIDPGYKK